MNNTHFTFYPLYTPWIHGSCQKPTLPIKELSPALGRQAFQTIQTRFIVIMLDMQMPIRLNHPELDQALERTSRGIIRWRKTILPDVAAAVRQ